ncbi:hypothetical protein KC727_02715, partial [Candidatus Kaiserbacteria bacterium]|nr:hypothetical protein [Candidatus Kaiserbacteria bacterium]
SYFNEKNSREGTLFQGVYKRAHVDSDTKLLHLAAYVNLNYTVHGFRNIHEVYKTSHVVYEGKKDCDFLETSMILDQFEGRSGYIKNAPRHCRYIFEQRAAEKNPNPNADLLE